MVLKIPDWRKFRVQTFGQDALREAAEQMAALARGFRPGVVLGIRSGGWHVAGLMMPHLPQAALLPITCRRSGTPKKQNSSALKALLPRLPYGITDRLRVAEHIVLTQLRPPRPVNFTPDAGEASALTALLRERGGESGILIVDDSVDSGATLRAVYECVRAIAGPAAAVKTAAVTVTAESPLIQPDFSLYHHVLCRFPWSFDFRG